MTAIPAHDASAPDGLMLFDGICRFCSTTVWLVSTLDRAGTIRFAPIQSDFGRDLCRTYGIDPDLPNTFLFFDRGQPLRASDAVAAIVARLPIPWRWGRVFAIIPISLRDPVYFWIARNRYVLFGKYRTCMVPSPALRARFVDQAPVD